MKKKLLAALLLVATCFCAAATAPVITQGPVLPWRVQVDLAFDANGIVTSAQPQVYYRQVITVDGAPIVRDCGAVTWDSVAKKDLTLSIRLADGTTATTTRGAVLGAVMAIAESERTAQP